MKLVYTNKNIDEFLSLDKWSSKFYLVAPKGYGKTLLLKLKSKLFRESKTGKFYPQLQLVESISPLNTANKKLSDLNNLNWDSFWEVVFFLLIEEYCKEGKAKNINAIISEVFDDWDHIERKTLEEVPVYQGDLWIFLDDIDKILIAQVNNYEELFEKESFSKIWLKIQTGFINSIWKLNLLNRKVRVFAAIRSIVFLNALGINSIQMRDYTTFLSYSKDEIQKIFELNLKEFKKNNQHKKELLKLIELNHVAHQYVYDKEGVAYKESLFDYIYRHTTSRPSEVIMVGSKIYNDIQNEYNLETKTIKEISELIKEKVSDLSDRILESYLNSIIFDFSLLKIIDSIRLFDSSILERKDLDLGDKSLVNTLNLLYNFGLLGWVKKIGKSVLQRFLGGNSINYFALHPLPESDFYILHPCLDKYINTPKTQFYQSLLIGDNLPLIMKNKYDYDIAFSFAGEDRDLVKKTTIELENMNVKVFYDEHEKANLWGKDLYQYLSKIYKEKAKYCVIVISKHYAKKLWTKHELRNAQERAFSENREYLLPARIDNTELPGLNQTIGYLSLKNLEPKQFADLIVEKIESVT